VMMLPVLTTGTEMGMGGLRGDWLFVSSDQFDAKPVEHLLVIGAD
jgi:hypothetical protein